MPETRTRTTTIANDEGGTAAQGLSREDRTRFAREAAQATSDQARFLVSLAESFRRGEEPDPLTVASIQSSQRRINALIDMVLEPTTQEKAGS